MAGKAVRGNASLYNKRLRAFLSRLTYYSFS